jgi:hypothetical protein
MPKYVDDDEFDGKIGSIEYCFQINGYHYFSMFIFRFSTVDEAEWPDFEIMYSEVSELMFDLVKDYIDSI